MTDVRQSLCKHDMVSNGCFLKQQNCALAWRHTAWKGQRNALIMTSLRHHVTATELWLTWGGECHLLHGVTSFTWALIPSKPLPLGPQTSTGVFAFNSWAVIYVSEDFPSLFNEVTICSEVAILSGCYRNEMDYFPRDQQPWIADVHYVITLERLLLEE